MAYFFLQQPFLRGTPNGQINAVHRTRETNPEKVDEFRQALERGDVCLGDAITKQQARKLAEMHIPVPEGVKISATRAG